jgi:hypothetical protein
MARKEHKFHYIYKITNTKNGNYYIGMHSTSNLEDGYMGGGIRIRNSIRKHGLEVHTKEILEFLDNRKSLSEREKEIVNESLLQDLKCLNLALGGNGGAGILTKEQLSRGGKESTKILWANPEFRKAHSKRASESIKEYMRTGKKNPLDWTGRKHSEETIILMKEKKTGFQIGNKNSQFGTRWITNEEENRKIRNEDPIPEGFRIGRVIKNKNGDKNL